jgi:uncharacterized lipoprotein YmbA
MKSLLWLLFVVSVSSGCALLGKGKPLAVRYFDLDANEAYHPNARAQSARLRLGSVSAVRAIDRRFASREGAHELSYHEAWRFTDQPEKFLARDLGHNLFERAGVTRVVSGLAPTLEVQLTAFEQRPDAHKVHVAALAVMHDDRVQLWQREFEGELPIGEGESAEAIAEALSKALAQVAARVTEETLAALAEQPAAEQQAQAQTQGQAAP